MDFTKITITTKASGSKKSKTRESPAQVVILGDTACFLIMKTKRDIKLDDHFYLSEIATVSFNNHIYLINSYSTTNIKSKYPILETEKIA